MGSADLQRHEMDLRTLLKSGLGRMFVASGGFKSKIAAQTTIVAFHRVNDQMPYDKALTCDSRTFRKFCTFFKNHYDVVPLSAQIAAVRAGKSLTGTLSITFDDGYLDNFEVAAPILRELGLPATFFVTTGFVGSQEIPAWDREHPSQPGWMNWDQVRALTTDGFEVGCHTHTHLDMGANGAEQILMELRKSRGILEAQTGKRIGLFAYPFGGRQNITDASRDLVRNEGFDCCVSCCGGTNKGSLDPFTLNRLPISGWFATPYQMAAEIVLGKA
jgi:peptidoglycan/xylan/chitin deacetylase (PgdA/CDA1 family)